MGKIPVWTGILQLGKLCRVKNSHFFCLLQIYDMKRLLLTILGFLPILCGAQEILTNADVIKLARLELPATAITAKIRNSKTHFDVSVDSLISLKKQGVSGEIVNEMIAAAAHDQQERASHRDPKDPHTPHKEGLYYYNPGDAANPLLPVDQSPCTDKGMTAGRLVSMMYTGGTAKTKQYEEISGPHAHRQIASNSPIFYFYFDTLKTTSPTEFALVRLSQKKEVREMCIGKSNSTATSFQIPEKDRVPFDYEQQGNGIFKVYCKEPLEPGEYCFVCVSTIATNVYVGKVYDFGIVFMSRK